MHTYKYDAYENTSIRTVLVLYKIWKSRHVLLYIQNKRYQYKYSTMLLPATFPPNTCTVTTPSPSTRHGPKPSSALSLFILVYGISASTWPADLRCGTVRVLVRCSTVRCSTVQYSRTVRSLCPFCTRTGTVWGSSIRYRTVVGTMFLGGGFWQVLCRFWVLCAHTGITPIGKQAGPGQARPGRAGASQMGGRSSARAEEIASACHTSLREYLSLF